MQQQPSPKSLKVCAIFNGCFSMAFDKFVHFFSQSVKYTYIHPHIHFSARGIGKSCLELHMSPPCEHFKHGYNPDCSGVIRDRRADLRA